MKKVRITVRPNVVLNHVVPNEFIAVKVTNSTRVLPGQLLTKQELNAMINSRNVDAVTITP